MSANPLLLPITSAISWEISCVSSHALPRGPLLYIPINSILSVVCGGLCSGAEFSWDSWQGIYLVLLVDSNSRTAWKLKWPSTSSKLQLYKVLWPSSPWNHCHRFFHFHPLQFGQIGENHDNQCLSNMTSTPHYDNFVSYAHWSSGTNIASCSGQFSCKHSLTSLSLKPHWFWPQKPCKPRSRNQPW